MMHEVSSNDSIASGEDLAASATRAGEAARGVAADMIAVAEQECARRIKDAEDAADRRAAAAEAAAAAVAQRVADSEGGNMERELQRRVAEIESAAAKRISAAEEAAQVHAMALEESSMEATRRIREVETLAEQRVTEAEAAAERRVELEKQFAEERIVQAEAAAEQRAQAAEQAAADVARRIADVEEEAAQQRVAAVEEAVAQHTMGLEAMVGMAAQRAAQSAAAHVALAMQSKQGVGGAASPMAASPHAASPAGASGGGGLPSAGLSAGGSSLLGLHAGLHAGLDGVEGGASSASELGGGAPRVEDRVGLRLRCCLDLAESVESWVLARAGPADAAGEGLRPRARAALRHARLQLVASSERLGEDAAFLEALSELLDMRQVLLGEERDEEADEGEAAEAGEAGADSSADEAEGRLRGLTEGDEAEEGEYDAFVPAAGPESEAKAKATGGTADESTADALAAAAVALAPRSRSTTPGSPSPRGQRGTELDAVRALAVRGHRANEAGDVAEAARLFEGAYERAGAASREVRLPLAPHATAGSKAPHADCGFTRPPRGGNCSVASVRCDSHCTHRDLICSRPCSRRAPPSGRILPTRPDRCQGGGRLRALCGQHAAQARPARGGEGALHDAPRPPAPRRLNAPQVRGEAPRPSLPERLGSQPRGGQGCRHRGTGREGRGAGSVDAPSHGCLHRRGLPVLRALSSDAKPLGAKG